jgi:GxxExxY protein
MIEMKHSDVTERIIRCAIDVHKALGPGLPREFYAKALAIELERSELPFLADVSVKVSYGDVVLGERRVPFLVADVVVLVPQTSEIDDAAIAGGVSLLRGTGKQVGLLLNFARARLDIRRIAN